MHFNSNEVNEVAVYTPPESGLCDDNLQMAKSLLNLKGRQEVVTRARQQFMAVLLNVAAGNVQLFDIASEDGATVSQAITYCDQLIDDPDGDHELARNIAEALNSDILLATGMIPEDIVNIAYRIPGNSTPGHQLQVNRPNPFNPMTKIAYSLNQGEHVRLTIYTLDGRLVDTLVNARQEQGNYEVIWNGTDSSGRRVSSGIYLYRLKAGEFSDLKKMTLLK